MRVAVTEAIGCVSEAGAAEAYSSRSVMLDVLRNEELLLGVIANLPISGLRRLESSTLLGRV